MDRRDFLKKAGLTGAIVLTIPVNPLALSSQNGFETQKSNDERILFAELDDRIYLLFDSGDRIFKETTYKSEGHIEYDMRDLKIRLVDSLFDYYG